MANEISYSSITLSNGLTSYRLISPSMGNGANLSIRPLTIVCLHGLTESQWVWEDLVEILSDSECGPGAQVLVFDFYGRGRSPWTGVPCTLNTLVAQTIELLDALNITSPVSLIGRCMGGAVAIGFAAKYPSRTASLCIFSAAGIFFRRSFSDFFLKRSCVGEVVMLARKNQLSKTQKREFYTTTGAHRVFLERQMEMVKWQLQNTPGYLGAILSTYRAFPLRGMTELYDLVGKQPRPVLFLWGDSDKVTPFHKVVNNLTSSFSTATITCFEGCGHNPLFEKFGDFVTLVVDFHLDLQDPSKGKSISLRVADRNFLKNKNRLKKGGSDDGDDDE